MIYNVVLPSLSKDLGLSDVQSGLVATVYAYCAGPMRFGGRISGRFVVPEAMLRRTIRSIDARELPVSRYNEDSKGAQAGMGAESHRADQETTRPRSRLGRTPNRDLLCLLRNSVRVAL